MALVGEIFIGILLTICILVFGISSQSRIWMPRPDQYFLSWSFGFIILAAICSFISSGFLYCISYTDRAAQEEVEKFEAVETNYGMPSVLSGRIGSGGLYSGGLSGIGGAGGVVVKVPSTGARPEQVIALDSDLRPMDTGHESMSLFSPSIGMITNNLYHHYKGIEKQSIPLNNQHSNELNSRTFSIIDSEQTSQETPLYINHPITKYNKHAIIQPLNHLSSSPSPSSSSNMKSYSPLGEGEDVEDLSMLSENPDHRRNTIIQRDNNNDYKDHHRSSPSPIRHSLPTSQSGYHHNTTRYSHY
ncbi:unnamed protein product [Schistosoma spindalis]|nr:unnamed protein product [Schistosoma spindale]